MSHKTLAEILKDCLKDNHKASMYEAKVVREMILADGNVSAQERTMLEQALHNNKFDEHAASMLSMVILRSDCEQQLEKKEKHDHGHGGSCCH